MLRCLCIAFFLARAPRLLSPATLHPLMRQNSHTCPGATPRTGLQRQEVSSLGKEKCKMLLARLCGRSSRRDCVSSRSSALPRRALAMGAWPQIPESMWPGPRPTHISGRTLWLRTGILTALLGCGLWAMAGSRTMARPARSPGQLSCCTLTPSSLQPPILPSFPLPSPMSLLPFWPVRTPPLSDHPSPLCWLKCQELQAMASGIT